MIVGGLDPGNKGAVGIYDGATDQLVTVFDLPAIRVSVTAKSKRWRLLEDELHEQFVMLKDLYDMRLLVVEQVRGLPGQSAPNAFQFGETYGVIRTTARFAGLPLHFASPAVWKLQMNVPKAEASIVAKANKDFPDHKHLWTSKRGALKHDRCEAGFLARYAWRKIWPSLQGREKLRKAVKGAPL